jgi:hypothetical protein
VIIFLIRISKGLLRVADRTLLDAAFITELDSASFPIELTTLAGISETLSSCASIDFWSALGPELH